MLTRFLLLLITPLLLAQGSLEDYQQAERLLHKNARKLTAHLSVYPQWQEEAGQFVYVDGLKDNGKRFMWVDGQQKTQQPLFDHEALAQALGAALDEEIRPNHLPFSQVEVKGDLVSFSHQEKRWTFDRAKGTLTHKEDEKKDDTLSPDGKWSLELREGNLFAIQGQQEKQLTQDGSPKNSYAYEPSWYHMENLTTPKQDDSRSVSGMWSPDSRRFVTFRLDRRKVGTLTLWQSVPDEGDRPEVFSYERTLPTDTEMAWATFYIFDVEAGTQIQIKLPPIPGYLNWYMPQWQGAEHLFMPKWDRAFKGWSLLEIDASTGGVAQRYYASSETNVDPAMKAHHVLEDRSAWLVTSEKDGYNHLYFCPRKGEPKQITQGPWVVNRIYHTDEKARRIYFSASGRESGRDPYLRHLYRVDFDGANLTLLTPEVGDHRISFDGDHPFFVDTYSLVNQAPTHVLRNRDTGAVEMTLGKGDIGDLIKAGWVAPEPFTVKARDGKTDLYGVLYKPANFDPSKRYPVIDATYSGPQHVQTPKAFSVRRSEYALARLGFVVMNVDGMGTARRSKAFHNVSYRNLGDIGAPDHMGALRQLAKKHPYLDLDRVGIYGHSAGGYDAARALLAHGDFYKVGVASAGNHDHRLAKIWWPELWMGPFGEHYLEQSNLKIAKNLKGHLLLVHGDMDNNVNPDATIRLADALIKANRDFDLLILPNEDHNLSGSLYFTRKRWDYFVTHLMGKTPPPQYEIQPMDD